MAIMDRSMEGKRQYTTGISKGVFFGEDGKAFPWNGLISVTEKPQANAPTPVYNSLGEKYDQFGNIAEKKHSLTCYTYPEEMDEFLGIEYLEEMGYSVDERPPKKFSMAYRTELGDGLYEIHVLLNQIATFGDTAKNTITNNITPTVVTMNLEGVPDPRIKSSHIILDSRLPLTESAERLLFGNNMVDGNINEFLDAEPTWVTVATNYAPIIEPDYDNMVWLGGENVAPFRDSASSTEHQIIHLIDEPFDTGQPVYKGVKLTSATPPVILMPNMTVKNGETYTASIYAKSNNVISSTANFYIMFYDRNTGSGLVYSPRIDNSSEWGRVTCSYTNNTGADHDNIAVYFYLNQIAGQETYFTSPKVELGSVATPWTPAPSDNYVPPADKPRPSNYVPGVKGGHRWDSRTTSGWNVTAFYDEERKGLGQYAVSIGPAAISRLIFRSPHMPYQSELQYSVEATVDIETSGDRSIWANPSPRGYVLYGGTPGVYNPSIIFSFSDDIPSRYIELRQPMVANSISLYRELSVFSSSYTGGFFDINTTPKTKGDRYVRRSTEYYDYTEHQQLILQSKSRVILSDITPNQYTLEASDSQLRVDGQTFTFKGPQATPVGDDQFTIDDEIYGEE